MQPVTRLSRRTTVIAEASVSRSARRRANKQWRKLKKEEKAWQSQTQKEDMWYEVVVPAPDSIVTLPHQHQQQHNDPIPPISTLPPTHQGETYPSEVTAAASTEAEAAVAAAATQSIYSQATQRPRKPVQAPVQGQFLRPGPVRGPSAPADALWIEHRRSEEEGQQFRQQRQRQRPQPRQAPSLEELLQTSEHLQHLQPALAANIDAVAPQMWRQDQPQQHHPVTAAVPRTLELSTDRLWREMYELQLGKPIKTSLPMDRHNQQKRQLMQQLDQSQRQPVSEAVEVGEYDRSQDDDWDDEEDYLNDW